MRINEVANAYHVYQQLLLDNSALDFGDLINYSLKLFRERPAVLEKYRKQFKYVLLDEFQDTNWAQYELIKMLVGSAGNLVVVGDDDQSVYKFRGASISNILQFKKDFLKSKEIFLVTNYRNKQNVLDLSYEFIKLNNPNRLEYQLNTKTRQPEAGLHRRTDRLPLAEKHASQRLVRLWRKNTETRQPEAGPPLAEKHENTKTRGLNKKLIAHQQGDGMIEIIQGTDLQDEVGRVVEKIADIKIQSRLAATKGDHANKKKCENASWNDFAILVRANNSAKDFCNALEIAGLPYQFLASRGLYSKPVIIDLIAYLKLLDDYHESAAVYRILNLPILNFSYQELVNFNYIARKKAWSLYTVLRDSHGKLGSEIQQKIDKILSLINKHTALARKKSVSEIILAFLNDSGYLKYLTSPPAPSPSQGEGEYEQESRENMSLLNQFIKRIKKFESANDDKSVKAFLAELNMEIDSGEQGSLSPDIESGPEAIKIMTIHGSKGLEFKYVFLANMVDKRFPTIERKEQILIPDALVKETLPEGDIHLEEERRLFYVAMTRAKNDLYFSWSPDYGGARKKKPSRFLAECGLINENIKTREHENMPVRGWSASGGKTLGLASEHENMETMLLDINRIPNKKLQQNKETEIQIPNYFSYTQLAAFSNCPYQYRFAHILRVPMTGKPVFSFGKTMHSALQKIFELVNEKKGIGQGSLLPLTPSPSPARSSRESGDANISMDEIFELYEKSWIDDWYESSAQKQEYKKKGREILKEFYQKHQDNWPNAVYLEKGFNIKLRDNGELYTVRGVIDRIDEDYGHHQGGAGKLKIVDYKTGSPKDKLSFNEKEQLLIYQMAVSEIFKQDIGSLSFYYLNNNSEVEFLGTEEDLGKVKDKILNIIKDIKKGEFLAKPSQLCKFCDFYSICEFRKN